MIDRESPPKATNPRARIAPASTLDLRSVLVAGLLVGLRALPLALSLFPTAARADEWKHLFDKDGAQVYSREVAGSPVKEFRVVATIFAPADRLTSIMYDISSHPQFLPPTETVEIVKQDASGTLFHMVVNPSWVSRRDNCLRHSLMRLADGSFRTEWHSTDEGCPAAGKGVVRMIRNDGLCLLTPSPDGQSTRVEYTAHHVPGGSIPAWMVNAGLPRSLPKVLQAVSVRASQPRYQATSTEVQKLVAAATPASHPGDASK